MNKLADWRFDDRSIDDKAYDLFGALLLEQETNRLLDELEKERAHGATIEMDAFFAEQDQRNLKQINNYFRRQHTKKLLTKKLPKVLQIVAILISCVSIVGGIALATNETVRVRVMKLLATMSDEYTSLKLIEDEDASFDIPTGWQGKNFPSYLPAELQVVTIHAYPDYHSISYRNTVNDAIQMDFSELGPGAETNIDTEDAAVCTVMIGNFSGFLVSKGEAISLYWSDGQHYFILLGRNIEKNTLMSVAQSVKSIQ